MNYIKLLKPTTVWQLRFFLAVLNAVHNSSTLSEVTLMKLNQS